MDPAQQPPRGQQQRNKHRRRRRGGGGPTEQRPQGAPAPQPQQGKQPQAKAAQQPKQQKQQPRPQPPRPPALPQVTSLVADKAPDAPLSPREVAEMKVHLAFIREHKAVLRLSLNSHEDLMVNGQRDPTERGRCKHLLAKVDRVAVEGALGRDPFRSNAAERLRFLEGAVRLTGDVGVLLTYLETVTQAKRREEAAAALQEAVRRIDFGALSAARLGRLLQILTEVFEGRELTRALLGLLQVESFEQAVTAAAAQLPDEVRPRIIPLHAVLQAARHARHTRTPEGETLSGLRTVLSLADGALAQLPESLRRGLAELSLGAGRPADVAERAANVLLPSLPAAGKDHLPLSMRHAAWLMERGEDAAARKLLESVVAAHKDARAAARWLAALGAPRVGPVALMEESSSTVRAGFLITQQRECLVRLVDGDPAVMVEVYRQLLLPGVASVQTHGVDGNRGWIALSGQGRPLPAGGLRERAARFGAAAQAVRLLRAAALAGVALPDAEPERFLAVLQPVALTLVDVAGAESVPVETALQKHTQHLRALLEKVLLPPEVESLGPWRDFHDVAALLDR